MSDDSRIKEAQQCIQKAEKLLKTSIWQLKTKPEYDLAAYEFDRAAICYKNAGQLDKAVEMYIKSADCHHNNNNRFHEAKSKEQAAMMAKEGNLIDEATKLFEESAQLYLEANSWDTACQVIEKAGKILEGVDLDKACALYEKGIKIVTEADRSKSVISLSQRLIGLLLRQKKYSESLKVSRSLIETLKEVDNGKVGMIGLGMVIISLLNGDSIAARQCLGYLQEDDKFALENQAGQALIVRYEKGDDEGLQEALRSGVIRAMDNHYLRIIKDLRAPESEFEVAGGGAANDDDEDDLR
ncbi:unnamed protein product [Bursaphelenchus okinawaensis]|uniref:Gamma-soluble NSF attachment protein n=1 Tax=Bursaphelenchus okinawaensis TaxID=465554 RepID=A0A811L432_9BILA|nr:unnamed protein product [Bursaphelenchus okinawaensis]CAG9119085.1 unnamed protein product [Bursaphelenchus okinawaensis]